MIVRYGPGHNLQDDWVFNRADIDGSAIVWARDWGRRGIGSWWSIIRGGGFGWWMGIRGC